MNNVKIVLRLVALCTLFRFTSFKTALKKKEEEKKEKERKTLFNGQLVQDMLQKGAVPC